MYIEAYQMLDNEPFEPDTTITHIQSLKKTISENTNIIINDFYSNHKIYKQKLTNLTIDDIFKNNNETNIQTMSNLQYFINNVDLVLSTIIKKNKELTLTDANYKEFGIYIKPDVNFKDKLSVHISNNIIPNLYWQSTIQWIEV